MKYFLQLVVLGWLSLSTSFVHAQLESQCPTCFTSEIIKAEKSNAQCTDYEIRVSYSGLCAHALSHFVVSVPSCATVTNLSNDQGYAQVFGYDPTTGLSGFKIDSVS